MSYRISFGAACVGLLLCSCQSSLPHKGRGVFGEVSGPSSGATPRPVLGHKYTWLPESQRAASHMERAVLALTNAARAQARFCGSQRFEPAPALMWNDTLAKVARNHSADMAARRYFSHSTPEGLGSRQRMELLGISPNIAGENIAANYNSAAEVLQDWLASPSHCQNIMNPRYRHMGAGAASAANNPYGLHWSQEFMGD